MRRSRQPAAAGIGLICIAAVFLSAAVISSKAAVRAGCPPAHRWIPERWARKAS